MPAQEVADAAGLVPCDSAQPAVCVPVLFYGADGHRYGFCVLVSPHTMLRRFKRILSSMQNKTIPDFGGRELSVTLARTRERDEGDVLQVEYVPIAENSILDDVVDDDDERMLLHIRIV